MGYEFKCDTKVKDIQFKSSRINHNKTRTTIVGVFLVGLLLLLLWWLFVLFVWVFFGVGFLLLVCLFVFLGLPSLLLTGIYLVPIIYIFIDFITFFRIDI